MDFKSLKKAFIRAVQASFGNTAKNALPCSHIDDLFDLDTDIYVEAPGKQWIPKLYMGLNADRAQNLGPAFVYYTHPGHTVPKPAGAEGILQEFDEDAIPASSAIIVSTQDLPEGQDMTLVIRNDINNANEIFSAMIFGMHCTRRADGFVKFHKIVMPEVGEKGEIKSMRNVDLFDRDDITRALAFAGLCVEQMVHRSAPSLYTNLKTVMKSLIDHTCLPWKSAMPKNEPKSPDSGGPTGL